MSHKRDRKRRQTNALKLSRQQVVAIAIVTIVTVSSLLVYAFLPRGGSNQLKAAIVDQLSSRADFQNATFVKTANATLTAAGYAVTYYKGSDATVNLFRSLPTYGYDLIILRVHSALYNGTDAPLDLFTSEVFDSYSYPLDRMKGYLDIAMYQAGAPPREQFFGIKPGFVSNAMQGNFQNATIILMGCNGLDIHSNGTGQVFRSLELLNAFVSKGARVLIGWDATVLMNRTDVGTAKLLQHLLVENQTVKNAVNSTNNNVGPDSVYGSALTYFPSRALSSLVDVGNYTIPRAHDSVAATSVIGNSVAGPLLMNFFALPISLSKKTVRKLIF